MLHATPGVARTSSAATDLRLALPAWAERRTGEPRHGYGARLPLSAPRRPRSGAARARPAVAASSSLAASGAHRREWRYFASCHPGLEVILARELASPEVGAIDVEPGKAGVSFAGPAEVAYRANLWSRTAIRVLQQLVQVELDPDQPAGEQVRSARRRRCARRTGSCFVARPGGPRSTSAAAHVQHHARPLARLPAGYLPTSCRSTWRSASRRTGRRCWRRGSRSPSRRTCGAARTSPTASCWRCGARTRYATPSEMSGAPAPEP